MAGIKLLVVPLVAVMGWYGASRILKGGTPPERSPEKGFGSPFATGFAVVELFTSEGCSSCPPADALLSVIRKDYSNEQVYVLGFHVDYWNRLGWADAFSNPDYTRRQSQYAQVLRLQSVYTPQVIVNGKKEFVGSDGGRIRSVINDELKNTAGRTAIVRVRGVDSHTIRVFCKLENPAGLRLQVALVQLRAASHVLAGENSGRTLDHVNVVRDFKTMTADKAGSGIVDLKIPQGLTEKDCKVIYFLQQDVDMHIVGAGEAESEQ
ncbi:MAG: DUF1223 domain-containing protein [Puia sp.]|nr:DUF1223 domain-containing protein [Puia sp.]